MFTKKETDFCKGIAIMLMLTHHLFYKPDSYARYSFSFWPLTQDQLTGCALFSKLCVAIFVFFSGYGIAATWHRKFPSDSPDAREVWNFTWRRYWKLMSGYWFVFLLTLLCQPFGRTVFDAYGTGTKNIAVYLAIDFFGLATFFNTPTLNPTWWYMTVAVTVVFVFPILLAAVRKAGPGVLIALFFVYAGLLNTRGDLAAYFTVGLLGILCHEVSLFRIYDRLGQSKKGCAAVKIIAELVILFLLVRLRSNYNYYRLVDGMCTVILALLVHTVLFKIPVVTDILQFLGRHSANMFLVHNQLYSLYFSDFFYSLRHWAVILAALTAASLLVSIAIGQIKKWIRYPYFMDRLGQVFLYQIPDKKE